MLPELYQATLVNFGTDVYLGKSRDEAIKATEKAGFETCVLLDGAMIAWFSPISGWKYYDNDLPGMNDYTYEQFSKDCDRW